MTDKEIFINIQEVKRAEIDAQLVAENVALQLVRRVGFRRAMKKAVTSALKLGQKALKLLVAEDWVGQKWLEENGTERVEFPFTPSGRISILA